MIPAEKASKFLTQHQSPELKPEHFSHLSQAHRQLANILISRVHHDSNRKPDHEVFVTAFGEDPSFNPWLSDDGKKLAVILYGAPKAHLVPVVWEITKTLPYQSGYSRRPFRRKPEVNPLERRLERMRQLYLVGKIGFAQLDILQTARYGGYQQWQAPNLALWFTAALNTPSTADSLREVLADIIAGEDETGIVNKGIIMGLLTTNDPQNWKLVEDLLLAAQRQEGLRQTVLESLDETSIGALQHFVRLILANDLGRFSSVIRAVDTWFGFGWEAPKKKTIERALTLADSLLSDPAAASAAITNSQDNLELSIALWSIGVVNVDEAIEQAVEIIGGESKTRRLVALMFLHQTGLSHKNVGAYIQDHFGEDLETDYWLLFNAPKKMELTTSLYDRIVSYGDNLPKEGKTFAGTVFSWSSVSATPMYFYNWLIGSAGPEQLRRLCEDITKVPSEARERLMRKIFPDNYSWSLSYGTPIDKKKAKAAAAEDWKRELIRQASSDRNSGVMATGIRFLGALELEDEDRKLIIDLLRRKGKELRSELIKVILGQEEATLKAIVSELIVARSVDQRLAALEILTVLYDANKLTTFVLAQNGLYRERTKFNKNEEVLLAKFDAPLENEISFANGFGVIDHDKLSPLVEPKIQFKKDAAGGLANKLKSAARSIVNQVTGGNSFLLPELVNPQKMFAAFQELFGLLQKHGKLEYEMWYNQQHCDLVLLENALGLTDSKAFGMSAREKLNYLPLAEVWLEWYQRSNLNDFELLFGIEALRQDDYRSLTGPFEPFLNQYAIRIPEEGLPAKAAEKRNSMNRLANMLGWFLEAFGDKPTIFRFQVDLLEDMIARIPADLQHPVSVKTRWGGETTVFWANHIQEAVPGNISNPTLLRLEQQDPAVVKRLWDLKMYLMARTLVQTKLEVSIKALALVNPGRNNNYPKPGIWINLFLHEKGLITDEDLLLQSLHLNAIFQLLNGNRNYLRRDKLDDLVVPEHIMPPLRDNLLELELQRGDLPTDATRYVNQITMVEGMNYLFETIERLGKETLHRGYSYGSETSKKESFSAILKKSFALETDTAPAFSARAKKSPVTTARWLEVAMYAPQWCPWIGEYLNIPDLEIAVWWFHAHASGYMNAHKETIISQFSPIEKADFREGAIDIDWFHTAYQSVGRKNWRLLHEASKYISDGNGHRQVKTYSAVMLGEVKITETLKKIKEKRDKVYVKALGLIPFSRTNPEKDVLNRYKLLQQFIQDSKQFGAQRQESEKTAARIGLDNLARNAGHEDTVRFGWIMEAETTRRIMERSLIGIDKVTVQLIIDEDGRPDILVAKDGKPQKTIPAKLRKHKAIVELKEHKTYLRKQFSRTRTSLENAMLNGTTFTVEDLIRISLHPVVRPLLSKLVLYSEETGATGFWRENQLVGLQGKSHLPTPDEKIVIAHPAHLYQLIEWDLYQKLAFDQQLVQPFKQIFRELYLITKDEKEAKIQSLRYQGHQIQPRKATALLRGRGWTISDSEGLQKVYHKQNVIATMYAMADWFSPSDVEVPVIEGVTFHSRKGQTLKLEDLDPVLFSEVMRDIDLVVSVAHVGGVDPEASHSTLQMRGALARETARLFKADNVEVKERHIVIDGKHGSYNIHLGSGMVSKSGLQLNIIAVQSQHRGRMFLPFLDDDPKSAEIISKMKLLAEDDRIKDPTVLGQILG
ncbi:DUF4132 domain-containing protein [Neolewinella aurantiaca]|uniref:DUF4132 domain-containing protein n=1 Tax=Neolewinella aurantiaca TaxID=2602767 RepID=A0A5C7FEP5_9BACT|nr:DUF4132 domain-containing protein [Neolewinella aurantiaca]TXF88725.1 DUF4132 domain-containing protein [Neolewinella aurantiaca]